MSKSSVEKERLAREEAREKKKLEKEKFWAIVDDLLMSESTGKEIASYFDISPDTLYTRCVKDRGIQWSQYAQQKKEKGDAILKHAQFNTAIKGKDTKMQIFLGKNRLGQTDRQVIQNETVQYEKIIIELPDNNRRKRVSYDNSNEIVINQEPLQVEHVTTEDKEI